MNNFKILRVNNKIVNFIPKNKNEDEITLTFKIINFIYPLNNKTFNYYNFNLINYKMINEDNMPSYWGGNIYSIDDQLINQLYIYGKIYNGWDYKNQNDIGFSCNKHSDTIIGNNFNVININGTYKAPSWIIQEMCRCIDEFMIFNIQNRIKNI